MMIPWWIKCITFVANYYYTSYDCMFAEIKVQLFYVVKRFELILMRIPIKRELNSQKL